MNVRNSVQLIGRLGADPEVVRLEGGSVVAKFSVATSDSYKNAKGEKVIETMWHRVEAWNKKAELIEKMLKKGQEVFVMGKLVYQNYEDKEGITRYVSKIKLSEFIKLSREAAEAA